MATICTPNYANIFMQDLKKTSYIHVFKHLQIFLLIYRGYFFTLEQMQSTIVRFHHNSRHPTVKLNSKYSKSSIELLETKIYKKKEKNKLLTTMYQKPTGLIILLDPTSAHPKLLINSISFSEALQLEKISSKTSELDKYLLS